MRSVYTWKLDDNLKQLPTVEAKFDLVAYATAFTEGPNWRVDASWKIYSDSQHVITFNKMRHKMPQSTKPLASSPVSCSSNRPRRPVRVVHNIHRSVPVLWMRMPSEDRRAPSSTNCAAKNADIGNGTEIGSKLVKAVERAESNWRKYEAAAAVTTSTTMSCLITICLPMIFLPF